MNRTLPALTALFAVLFASCTGTSGSKIPPPTGRSAQILAEIEINDALDKLSDEQKGRLEIAASRTLAGGKAMITPILGDILNTGNQNRRLVLVKILFRIVDSIPADSPDRDAHYADIENAARRLRKSKLPGDRYMAVLLVALPQHSQLIPSAIRMLADDDEGNRAFAAKVLQQAVSLDMGYRPSASLLERKAAIARWNKWWRKNRNQDIHYLPMGNPVLRGLRAERSSIRRSAGPFAFDVLDENSSPVPGAVVAYSYYFGTPDGVGKIKKHQAATDREGKALLAYEGLASGMRFLGAEILVSKIGYQKQAYRLRPNILTPNTYSITVALEPE